MIQLLHITPNGQVTIPRSVMRSLGISGGSEILIEIEDGQLILQKVGASEQENERYLICEAC